MPIRNVSIPVRHHGVGDHRLRSEPIEKKVMPVITVEAQIEAGRAEDERQQRNRAAHQKGEKGRQRRPRRRAADRRKPVLLGHHGVDPAVARAGDDIDGAVERLAREALGLEDLPDLLALAFGRKLDMPLLHPAHLLVFLDLGLGPGIVGGGHGEAVGEQIGGAEDEQGLGGKLRADHPCHHGEGGHRAVDTAIDPIAQIADARPLLEALGDVARGVSVLEMSGVHASSLAVR